MDIATSDLSDTDFDIGKPCNHCGEVDELYSNKPYCIKCKSNMVRECVRCHIPYSSMRHFELDKKRCNSCHRKFEAEKIKREQRKKEKESLDQNKTKNEEIKTSTETSAKTSVETILKNRRIGYIPIYL